MAGPRQFISVTVDPALHDEIVAAAGANVAEWMRQAAREKLHSKPRAAAAPMTKPVDNPFGCPNPLMPCSSAEHPEAEQRILDELPTYRRRWIAPRQPGEGPHEYNARFWADERVKRAAAHDIELAFGWAKEDDK